MNIEEFDHVPSGSTGAQTDRRLRVIRPVHEVHAAPHLSDRERQLVTLAADGHTDVSIAQHLGISEATVGTYWGRIRVKMGPYSRTELVSIVIRAEQATLLDQLRVANVDLVRRLHEQQEELGGLYERLIDGAPDAILLTSAHGTILEANPAAHEVFGYDAGELIGTSLARLVPHRFRDVHADHVAEYSAGQRRHGGVTHRQVPCLRKDGSEVMVQTALSAISTPSGVLVMSFSRLTSGSDVTGN